MKAGCFWQNDGNDGMEVSIGGSGCRATINSYQYGDALAISRIAELDGQPDLARTWREKAAALKALVQAKLWDPQAQFFMVLPRGQSTLANVRELHGYTPWYFNLPDAEQSVAWRQLMDPLGFHAPFGPTTAEQRHPGFAVNYHGHECQWNGPSWPLATSVTLTALANLLNNYSQDVVTKADYWSTLQGYVRSHRFRQLPPGAANPSEPPPSPAGERAGMPRRSLPAKAGVRGWYSNGSNPANPGSTKTSTRSTAIGLPEHS
jgi:glycogen debranching enzyme